MSKSPFIIVQNFISPLTCEKIIDEILITQPDVDQEGIPKKLERHSLFWEHEIAQKFHEIIPNIESTYGATYLGLEKPIFQYFPENPKQPAEQPGCGNSKFLRKKWVMHKDVDLIGFIWLKDYNDQIPLDTSHEVLGGKLEFPLYNFSLVPQRGTLVIFPACPHFITAISPIMLGDLYQIKLNITIRHDGARWLYQPAQFPGTWQDWFKEHF